MTSHQRNNIEKLFHLLPETGKMILDKKMYGIIALKYHTIKKYANNQQQLIRIDKLSRFIEVDCLELLLENCDPILINRRNYKELEKFVQLKEKFENKELDIKWGPGNHGTPEYNLYKHYEKHVLDDLTEQVGWKEILPYLDMTQYEKYTVESFYKMERVLVHTHGRSVYLSGFYGKTFIIGRLEKNEFGISSCYIANNDKKGRETGTCFDISL